MKKKFAVPVTEDGILNTHFGHCRYFSLITTINDKIVSEELRQPPPHEPGILPQWLAQMDVTDVLAGGIGQQAIHHFNTKGIQVYSGAPKVHANQLVDSFLKNTLQFTDNR